MDTILIGYDGSDQADRALERGAELAEALTAKVVVVSVSRRPYVPAGVPVLEPDLAYMPSPVGGPMESGGTMPTLPAPGEGPDPKELAQRLLESARTALVRRKIDAEY